MTAKMTRNILLMLVATVLMGIVLNLYIHNTGTVPAADNAAPLTDGSYTSSAQGCVGEVTVTVTVTGGKVKKVATGYTRALTAKEFATVQVGMGAAASGKKGSVSAYGWLPGGSGASGLGIEQKLPSTRTASKQPTGLAL